MSRQERFALVSALLDELAQQKSWCGETHLQKATYLAQEMLSVPFGFDFILYKHGPFSFDLRDEITAMRADGFLQLVPQGQYGPTLSATDLARQWQRRFARQLTPSLGKIRFVAQALGQKRVAELERVATAFYVTREPGADASIESRAIRLVTLKPHVDRSEAEVAVAQVDQMLARSAALAH